MKRAQWIQIAHRLDVDLLDLLTAVAEEGLGAGEDLGAPTRSVGGERLAYSVREVADALGTSPDLVRALVRRGELRGVRLGRRVVIPAVELDRWLERPPVDRLGRAE